MLFKVSFHFWYYPFLMSVFYCLQTLTGKQIKYQCNLTIPILTSFAYLLGLVHLGAFSAYNLYLNWHRTRRSLAAKPVGITTVQAFASITKEESNEHKVGIWLKLLLGLVNTFSHALFFTYIWFQEGNYSALQSFLSIICTSVFCFLILRTRLYRHHSLAIAIFFVDVCIYIGVTFQDFKQLVNGKIGSLGLFIALMMMYIIPNSLREVIEKYIFVKDINVSAEKLLVIEGLFSFTVFMAYMLIMGFVNCDGFGSNIAEICKKSQWFQFKDDLTTHFTSNWALALAAYGYVLATYIANIFRANTIQKLSPTHRYVAEMLFQLYWFIIHFFTTKENAWQRVGNFFQVIVLLFASFVFNEYLIIKRCKLDYNTFEAITQRSELDKNICLDISSENLLGNEE